MAMTKGGVVQRLMLWLVPRLYLLITRLIFATVRQSTSGKGHIDRLLASETPFIACLWHYSILYSISRTPGRDWVIMASASADADYVARVLNLMGHATMRGSRNRGGVGALREMIAQMRDEGRRAAIVADGSQGPALELQPGVILLASKTGAPILPLAWGADRYWAFRSWDRTALPKPFARVNLCFAEPYFVPKGLSSQGIEAHRLQLQVIMHQLYTEAWRPFGVRGHADQVAPIGPEEG